jgi:hypothetical protein
MRITSPEISPTTSGKYEFDTEDVLNIKQGRRSQRVERSTFSKSQRTVGDFEWDLLNP